MIFSPCYLISVSLFRIPLYGPPQPGPFKLDLDSDPNPNRWLDLGSGHRMDTLLGLTGIRCGPGCDWMTRFKTGQCGLGFTCRYPNSTRPNFTQLSDPSCWTALDPTQTRIRKTFPSPNPRSYKTQGIPKTLYSLHSPICDRREIVFSSRSATMVM